jgi:hypothetical protein
LTRWGHTASVFDSKIYVFGGRFCNDLQDVIMIDPERDALKTVRVGGLIPKARRRHTAAFVGSCMVVFGGFNGEYFNDMTYINLFDPKPTPARSAITRENELAGWVGKTCLSDTEVTCIGGKPIPVHKGLLAKHFKS